MLCEEYRMIYRQLTELRSLQAVATKCGADLCLELAAATSREAAGGGIPAAGGAAPGAWRSSPPHASACALPVASPVAMEALPSREGEDAEQEQYLQCLRQEDAENKQRLLEITEGQKRLERDISEETRRLEELLPQRRRERRNRSRCGDGRRKRVPGLSPVRWTKIGNRHCASTHAPDRLNGAATTRSCDALSVSDGGSASLTFCSANSRCASPTRSTRSPSPNNPSSSDRDRSWDGRRATAGGSRSRGAGSAAATEASSREPSSSAAPRSTSVTADSRASSCRSKGVAPKPPPTTVLVPDAPAPSGSGQPPAGCNVPAPASASQKAAPAPPAGSAAPPGPPPPGKAKGGGRGKGPGSAPPPCKAKAKAKAQAALAAENGGMTPIGGNARLVKLQWRCSLEPKENEISGVEDSYLQGLVKMIPRHRKAALRSRDDLAEFEREVGILADADVTPNVPTTPTKNRQGTTPTLAASPTWNMTPTSGASATKLFPEQQSSAKKMRGRRSTVFSEDGEESSITRWEMSQSQVLEFFEARPASVDFGALGSSVPLRTLINRKHLQIVDILVKKEAILRHAHLKGQRSEEAAVEALIRALRQCDYARVPPEVLDSIRNVMKTHVEEKGSKTVLAFVEEQGVEALERLDHPHLHRLLHGAMGISGISARLECMVAEATWDESIRHCRDNLEVLREGFSAIRQVLEPIKSFFAAAKHLGNLVNQDSIVPVGTYGFKLCSLPKLFMLRSPLRKEVSLGHVALLLTPAQKVDALCDSEALEALHRARTARSFTVYQVVLQLLDGYRHIVDFVRTGLYKGQEIPRSCSGVRQTEAATDVGDENADIFHKRMEQFVKRGRAEAVLIETFCRDIFQVYRDFAVFFDDFHALYPPPSDEQTERKDLFDILHVILANVKQARQDVQDIDWCDDFEKIIGIDLSSNVFPGQPGVCAGTAAPTQPRPPPTRVPRVPPPATAAATAPPALPVEPSTRSAGVGKGDGQPASDSAVDAAPHVSTPPSDAPEPCTAIATETAAEMASASAPLRIASPPHGAAEGDAPQPPPPSSPLRPHSPGGGGDCSELDIVPGRRSRTSGHLSGTAPSRNPLGILQRMDHEPQAEVKEVQGPPPKRPVTAPGKNDSRRFSAGGGWQSALSTVAARQEPPPPCQEMPLAGDTVAGSAVSSGAPPPSRNPGLTLPGKVCRPGTPHPQRPKCIPFDSLKQCSNNADAGDSSPRTPTTKRASRKSLTSLAMKAAAKKAEEISRLASRHLGEDPESHVASQGEGRWYSPCSENSDDLLDPSQEVSQFLCLNSQIREETRRRKSRPQVPSSPDVVRLAAGDDSSLSGAEPPLCADASGPLTLSWSRLAEHFEWETMVCDPDLFPGTNTISKYELTPVVENDTPSRPPTPAMEWPEAHQPLSNFCRKLDL